MCSEFGGELLHDLKVQLYDCDPAADPFDLMPRHEEAAGARWVDVTPISRDGLVREGLVCDDGLHPSAKQYGEWVEAALPEIRAALSAVAGAPRNSTAEGCHFHRPSDPLQDSPSHFMSLEVSDLENFFS